jgi:hypothetical protein
MTEKQDWRKTAIKFVIPVIISGILEVLKILGTGEFGLEFIAGGFVTGLYLGWQNYQKHKND